jgi:thiamine biosynthesis lipoprotein
MVLTSAGLFDRMAAVPPQRHGDYTRLTFQAMGTQNSILFRAPAPALATAFREAALRWLAGFEARFSAFIPESLIGRLNAAAGNGDWFEVDAEAQEVLALCDWFHWKTNGIFDPTAGTLTRLWDYRRALEVEPTALEITAARDLLGWGRVERTPGRIRLPRAGMQLDLGGIGKEYAVDRIAELAQRLGIADFLVDFGRDVRAAGSPPEGGDWRVGLEHPEQPDACWSSVGLHNAALCCSGDYRRYAVIGGRRYSHLLDPRTGRPAQAGVHAAWVIAPTCTEAGILTTAACILGASAAGALFDQTPGTAGCVWSEQGLFQSRRFQAYELKAQKIGA